MAAPASQPFRVRSGGGAFLPVRLVAQMSPDAVERLVALRIGLAVGTFGIVDAAGEASPFHAGLEGDHDVVLMPGQPGAGPAAGGGAAAAAAAGGGGRGGIGDDFVAAATAATQAAHAAARAEFVDDLRAALAPIVAAQAALVAGQARLEAIAAAAVRSRSSSRSRHVSS